MNARKLLPGIICGIFFTLSLCSSGTADDYQRPVVLSPREITEVRDKEKVDFIWSKVPSAAQYHVVLSKDRRFKEIIYENARISDTSVTIGNLDYGTYFFKVSPVSREGIAGPYSDTLTFIVVPHHSSIKGPQGTDSAPAPR